MPSKTTSRLRLVLTVLGALGVAACVALAVTHWQLFHSYDAGSYCAVGETFDCRSVALSRFAVVGDVPLPIWGFAGLLAVGLAVWRRSGLASPLAISGAAISIALLIEELVHVGAICLLCEVVHVVFLALAVVTELWRRHEGLALRPTSRDLAGVLVPPALLLALAYVAIPRYWASAEWLRGELTIPHGEDDEGHPWIGATDPRIVVEEWVNYRCPHCAVASRRMARWVAEHPEEIRLVRRQQPGVRCIPLDGPHEICLEARAAWCAGKQGKFWAMDAWLFTPGRVRTRADLEPAWRALGLDAEAFDTCLDDPASHEAAARDYEEARRARILATPTYRVDGRAVPPSELRSLLQARLSEPTPPS